MDGSLLPSGVEDLLYTPDADFSCFANLALTSPENYYIARQVSLLQCVLTPGNPYKPLPKEDIVRRVSKQKMPIKKFFLAGSYTKQDYIDSMKGATLSGSQSSAYKCDAGEELVALRKLVSGFKA